MNCIRFYQDTNCFFKYVDGFQTWEKASNKRYLREQFGIQLGLFHSDFYSSKGNVVILKKADLSFGSSIIDKYA